MLVTNVYSHPEWPEQGALPSLFSPLLSNILSRVFLHVATINVDSPDLTRKFIATIAEITHNSYNTLSRLIAHKRVSSNITIKTQL
jgi:hypothetical protein